MRRAHRWTTRAAGLLLLVLLSSGAERAAAQSGKFSETTDVVVVEVPVQVLQDGKPVRGLTAADFEVYDGRKEQDLVGFDVIDLTLTSPGVAARPVPELPVALRRHFLLLFDLSFSKPSAITRAREAADRLVLNGLHPTDLVAVATYSESKGPRLVLGFTSDRDQVRVAIDTLGLADPLDKASDPLGILIADNGFGAGAAPEVARVKLGPLGDREQLIGGENRSLSNLSGRAARDQRVDQVLALTSSLGQIAALLGSIQGRKHVVYFSEGFDTSLVTGTGASTEEERDSIEEMNEASASGRYDLVDSEERFGRTSTLSGVTQMLEEFRRADCSIEAVDIGGLRAGGAVEGAGAEAGSKSRGEDGLFMMANETGGSVYRNFNDLNEAMQGLMERTSVTYVLAFQPRDLKLDGEFHRLRVKLKNPGKGMSLVHKPGYYSPRSFQEMSPLERRLRTAEVILGGNATGSLVTSVLAVPVPVPGEKAYVPVLIEVDGNGLLAGQQGDVVPAEIYAYAMDASGGVRDFFTQSLGLDRKQAEPLLRRTGFKFWGHFDLEPGSYVLRILARNGETGASGLSSVDLRVPDFAAQEAALLPPLFPEPAGKWLLGREQDQRKVPYPFMLGGQPFIPAAHPTVSAQGGVQICLQGYHLTTGPLTVKARLFQLDGSPVEGGELTVDQRAGGAAGADQMVASFRTGKVPAGQYRLVVTVTDPESGESQSSAIELAVEG